jgi:hypothetical protein
MRIISGQTGTKTKTNFNNNNNNNKIYFENGMLRKIFGPKREEDGSWRKLHNVELRSLYSSPNIVRVIKSRRKRWDGHMERMVRGKLFTGF